MDGVLSYVVCLVWVYFVFKSSVFLSKGNISLFFGSSAYLDKLKENVTAVKTIKWTYFCNLRGKTTFVPNVGITVEL